MTLFDGITFKHPVLRVNNRDHNIDFYKRLGFKLVVEENALAIFSAKNKKASFIIEESPHPRTRAVEGTKKTNQLIVKLPNANELLAVLGNGVVVERLFEGDKGFAFETISPEGDLFLLHAEDDVATLKEIEPKSFPQNGDLAIVSDFQFEQITLNVANEAAARAFYDDVFAGEFLVDMRFVQASGPDLTVEPHETWDLEILECQVPQDYDLKHLSDFLEQKGQEVYLDKKEKVLVLSDPNRIEIWFTK